MAFVLLSGIVSPAAHAADANNPDGAFNVVVSPPSVGITAKPGASVTTDLKVQNQGLSTEHVKVTIMKFGAHGQDGTPQLLDLEANDEFAKWATFSNTRFDAEPNVWKTIKLTVNPPKTAAFGYYYAVVFSRDGAEGQVQKNKSNLLGAVASLVLLDVDAPGAIRKTNIAEFSTAHKVQEFLPATFTVRMHNTGNTHVAPRGNIFITKGGKEVAMLEVNFGKGYVLPDTYRKFTSEWNDGAPSYKVKTADGKTVLDKNNKPVTELSWDKLGLSKLRMGKYDARLVMVYDDGKGDVSIESKLSFWVMPWRIIGVFLVVALFVIAGLWATVIRPVRNRLKKSRGHADKK